MINTAIFMGRLTADPELRHTSSDTAVTSFTVAADRSYVKTGAERQAVEVVADQAHFAGPKREQEGGNFAQPGDGFQEITADDDLPFN